MESHPGLFTTHAASLEAPSSSTSPPLPDPTLLISSFTAGAHSLALCTSPQFRVQDPASNPLAGVSQVVMDRALPTMHTPSDLLAPSPSPPHGDVGDAATHCAQYWHIRSFDCQFCPRIFRTAQALGGHMNVHRRERALANDMEPPPSPHPPAPGPPGLPVQLRSPPAFLPLGGHNYNFDPAAPHNLISQRCMAKHSSPTLCWLSSLPPPSLTLPPASHCASAPSSTLTHVLPPQRFHHPHPLIPRFNGVSGAPPPVFRNVNEGENYPECMGSCYEITSEVFRDFMSRSRGPGGSRRGNPDEEESSEENLDLDLHL